MQRDVVLRWIEQIVATVRRMLLGPSAVDPAVVDRMIDDAIAKLLGPLTLLVPQLDPASAAALLRDPERITGLVRLLELKAMVLERIGKGEEGQALRDRATALSEAGQRTA
jgi:hypothetical protein